MLERLSPHDHRDPYGYGIETAKAYVSVTIGGHPFDTFTIDVSQRRHVDGPVELLAPVAVIGHEALTDLPPIPVVPVENHIADKICTLYEVHQGPQSWSTRYRDLADLVRIVSDLEIDARRLTVVLDHERQRRRMPPLPAALTSPDESWTDRFPRAAHDFTGYPQELHSLDASLAFAGSCLNPVLAGKRSTGRWDPADQCWND